MSSMISFSRSGKKKKSRRSKGSSKDSSIQPSYSTDDEIMAMNGDSKILGAPYETTAKLIPNHMPDSPSQRLNKTNSSSFLQDLGKFEEGTIPQGVVVAIVVGVICGIAANIYYKILFALLEYIWHTFPQNYIVPNIPETLWFLYIPIIGFIMAVFLGLTVVYVGEPGDLAYTVKCVHEKAYVAMSHVMPMVCASQFSILGGGSLGPEAPLVAICASLGGWVSRTLFQRKNRNIVRKHTLMGMAGALAAFFGSPLGGSMFALEVNSRFGIEYFEHMIEAIFCGEVTLAVFRWTAGLPIAPIWTMPVVPTGAEPVDVLIGAGIGLVGAGIAALFAHFHWAVLDQFEKYDLLDNDRAVKRGLVGAVVVVALGILIPQTMFWGEYEFETIVNMKPSDTLEHVWPTTGLTNFQMETAWHCLIVGFAKLIAISFTVAGGYRGGFIFPFFATGAALGRAANLMFPWIPIPVGCLGFAAAINVTITRTSLATPIILCFLAGEQNAMSGTLAASLVALFATSYMPFIKSQRPREDLASALYFNYTDEPIVEDEEHAHEKLPPEEQPLMMD